MYGTRNFEQTIDYKFRIYTIVKLFRKILSARRIWHHINLRAKSRKIQICVFFQFEQGIVGYQHFFERLPLLEGSDLWYTQF